MKSKHFLIALAAILLLTVYGWRCASSKSHQDKNKKQETTSDDVYKSGGVVNVPSGDEKKSSSASGSISVSTAHAIPLYKEIHSACVVDIFFSKGMQPRDIL